MEMTIEIKPTEERNNPAAILPKSVSRVLIVSSDDYESASEALACR
jgi:hypothetical protein